MNSDGIDYRFGEDPNGGNHLVLRGGISSELLAAVEGLEFKSLVLSYGRWPDLNFLRGRMIDRLHIRGECVDWDSICQLDNLRVLEVESPLGREVDFGAMRELRYLDVDCAGIPSGSVLKSMSIEALRLRRSKATVRAKLSMPKLRSISLIQGDDLVAVGEFSALSGVDFAQFVRCSRLVEFGDLSSFLKLRCLVVEACNKISTLRGVASAPVLEEFSIGAKAIDSLKWLLDCQRLERFRFDCRVSDGDLGYLLRISKLRSCLFRDSKGYSMKFEEVERALKAANRDDRFARNEWSQFPAWHSFVIR